jgi:hypothetical protein
MELSLSRAKLGSRRAVLYNMAKGILQDQAGLELLDTENKQKHSCTLEAVSISGFAMEEYNSISVAAQNR